MKREGRQHGVVRSYAILPSPFTHRKYVKTVDPASVTGIFTKVSSKPTNHSKFTGKCSTARCNGCHIHPASKSKDKAKGTMKLRSIGSDCDLIRCPAGTSASVAFGYLVYDGDHDAGDEYEVADDDLDYGEVDNYNARLGIGLAAIVTHKRVGGGEEDDECMSYCDVGLCWAEGGDDDDEWYLVGAFE